MFLARVIVHMERRNTCFYSAHKKIVGDPWGRAHESIVTQKLQLRVKGREESS